MLSCTLKHTQVQVSIFPTRCILEKGKIPQERETQGCALNTTLTEAQMQVLTESSQLISLSLNLMLSSGLIGRSGLPLNVS